MKRHWACPPAACRNTLIIVDGKEKYVNQKTEMETKGKYLQHRNRATKNFHPSIQVCSLGNHSRVKVAVQAGGNGP
jgi:hypothetical protein